MQIWLLFTTADEDESSRNHITEKETHLNVPHLLVETPTSLMEEEAKKRTGDTDSHLLPGQDVNVDMSPPSVPEASPAASEVKGQIGLLTLTVHVNKQNINTTTSRTRTDSLSIRGRRSVPGRL